MSEGPPGMAGHEARMRMALRQAGRAAEAGEVPVGAVIFNSGELAGQAWNQTQTLKDPTAHAEIIPITQAAAAAGARGFDGADALKGLDHAAAAVHALGDGGGKHAVRAGVSGAGRDRDQRRAGLVAE